MNRYYNDSFVAVGIENLSDHFDEIMNESYDETTCYGQDIFESINNTKDSVYSNVLHAMITEEESKFTGLNVGDYFTVVYSTWEEEEKQYITYVANDLVSKIIKNSLPYMFRFHGGFPHIYFDLQELRAFTEMNGVNQVRITITDDADIQQILKDLYPLFGNQFWIETYHDLLTQYKASDAKKIENELITLLLTTFQSLLVVLFPLWLDFFIEEMKY